MTEKLLLEIIVLLLGLFAVLLGYLARQHDTKHEELLVKIESIRSQRETCLEDFADHEENRTSHARMFNKIDDLSVRVVRIETKIGINHEL